MIRLIPMSDAAERVGISKSKAYELLASGEFPGSVKVSDRAVRFYEHEINAYITAIALEKPPEFIQMLTKSMASLRVVAGTDFPEAQTQIQNHLNEGVLIA